MGSGFDVRAPSSPLLAEGGLSALPHAELTPSGAGAELDRDWLAVGASAVGMVLCVGTLALYSFGVFVRPLTAEFGWSRTGLFAALSFFQFGLAFCSPVWGVVLDRFGPRRVILFSLVALSLLVASLGLLTPNLWHLYLVFLGIPLLGGGASPLGYSAIMVRRGTCQRL